jgi:hypothetical protein
LSWTLDRAVAESFARGHRGIRPGKPIVVGATIKREAVALAIDDRGEAEIVIFSPGLEQAPFTASRLEDAA